MNTKIEKKQEQPFATPSVINSPANAIVEQKHDVLDVSKASTNQFRNEIVKLNAELTTLVESVVKQRAPGTSFNPALVREMRKIETRKNRLIMTYLDTLIKQGNPEVQQVIDRLLAIEV